MGPQKAHPTRVAFGSGGPSLTGERSRVGVTSSSSLRFPRHGPATGERSRLVRRDALSLTQRPPGPPPPSARVVLRDPHGVGRTAIL
ncbi:hypothetical protein GUJ93_ZPchr0013g37216 [Zizania palustris]|uniref:Uncharacterized protein n=1 Tax=Zizania palustris TaxID=103762 RepID=A0A8J5X491_ZIZPA|nr:hypothetical protein GUJ93_ZPchr0013g37216 [Zizania palustris]